MRYSIGARYLYQLSSKKCASLIRDLCLFCCKLYVPIISRLEEKKKNTITDHFYLMKHYCTLSVNIHHYVSILPSFVACTHSGIHQCLTYVCYYLHKLHKRHERHIIALCNDLKMFVCVALISGHISKGK